MKLFVGVTDFDWFDFLRSQKDIDEVNFWQPSGNRNFRALAAGEPFLFKLHSPNNFIVGGGFFRHFSIVPVSLAWEAFDVRNGARDLVEMRTRVERYRKQSNPQEDYNIGCILLGAPFFFPEPGWIPIPPNWAPNIVQGRGYEASTTEGADLWRLVEERLRFLYPAVAEEVEEPAAMFGEPTTIQPRLGQGTFRLLITDSYQRRCAMTGERALPVLEAAHIKPVARGGIHALDNGLLLRSDLHRLYDRGYITVTPDHQIHVSNRLKTDFDNGEPYYPLRGQRIALPTTEAHRPKSASLEWHADTVYLG